MKPSVLHFDWWAFVNNARNEKPSGEPPEVKIYTDQTFGENKGMPVLLLRVWYDSPRGMIAYVGDRVTGPVTVWALIYADLIRILHWAATEGVKLSFAGAWAADWDEVQP